MSDERNETWADIAADIRERAENAKRHGDERPTSGEAIGNLLLSIADRIVEAVTREGIRRDKTSFHCGDCAKFGFDCDAGDVDGNEDCLACENFVRGDHFRGATKMVGNAAALQQALELIKQYFDKIDPYNPNTYTFSQIEVENISKTINAALAAPPRNCDVGTAEEQAERFKRFCDEHTDSGRNQSCGMCPILSAINRGGTKDRCPFYWGQMTCLETDGGGAK